MKNSTLFTLVLAFMASLLFVACDDKDNDKQETNVCAPASCEMAEHATEMGCDDAGHCVVKACAENFKAADDNKSCVEDAAPKCEGEPACNPACEDGSDCICRDGAWACVPADVTDKCDPKCPEGKKCECTNDVCACADIVPPKNDCDGKSAGDDCGEGKTCQAEGEGLACKDKPATASTCDPACDADTQECKCDDPDAEGKVTCACEAKTPADPCSGKSENDECGENKTCQKSDGDALSCKDKPADPAPANPEA